MNIMVFFVEAEIICSSCKLPTTPPPCDSCLKGKSTQASFPASQSKHAKTVLGLVHSDLWGPAPVQTLNGSCYLLTLTDNKSQRLWVYFLKKKSQAFTTFQDWLAIVEKQSNQKLLTWESLKHFLSNKALFIKWQHLEPLNPWTEQSFQMTESIHIWLCSHDSHQLWFTSLPLGWSCQLHDIYEKLPLITFTTRYYPIWGLFQS